ncbi:DUF456 domain-containing protein [Metallococcus carri]|uniref:DUF456 domain-containing protein n=1 Tax=Metallococcus carri TaxID=1656884 RepID=UPI0038B32575
MNNDTVTVVSGLIIAAGILGLIVPILPGLALTLLGVLVWAGSHGGTTAWVIFGICVVIAAVGYVLQYRLPNRRLKTAGVPGWSRLAGVVTAAVGFFVVPVVGLFLGFVLGVYVAEQLRLRNPAAAWTSTKAAVRAVLHSVGIELAAACLVAATWVVGLIVT